MSSVLLKLRYVNQSQAMTADYRPPEPFDDGTDTANYPYIGTSGCNTSVGVYFPIGNIFPSPSRHFIARISPQVYTGTHHLDTECTEAECQAIGDKVLQQLRDNERVQHWVLDRKLAREKLIMCCPQINRRAERDPAKFRSPGLDVVKAIRKFLECEEDDQPVAYDKMEGFIVDLRNASVVSMLASRRWDDMRFRHDEPPQLAHFERLPSMTPQVGSTEDWLVTAITVRWPALPGAKDKAEDVPRPNLTHLDDIPHIGTGGCISCVGVYFPIGDGLHFIAHISPLVDLAKQFLCMAAFTEAESKEVGDRVLHQLQETERLQGWNLDRRLAREKLVICCPRMNDKVQPGEANLRPSGVEYRTAGLEVVKAMRTFLGCPKEDQAVAHTDMEGSIVDLRDEEVQMLPVRDWRSEAHKDDEPAELARFERLVLEMPEDGSVDQWVVFVRPPDE